MRGDFKQPKKNEVDAALYQVAARSLDGQPIGSTVMVNGVIGYKKMSFWWNFRVHGVRGAILQLWRDRKARKDVSR